MILLQDEPHDTVYRLLDRFGERSPNSQDVAQVAKTFNQKRKMKYIVCLAQTMPQRWNFQILFQKIQTVMLRPSRNTLSL